MNKRYLHHLWTKCRRIKPWYFLIVAIISTTSGVMALRANNQHMGESARRKPDPAHSPIIRRVS